MAVIRAYSDFFQTTGGADRFALRLLQGQIPPTDLGNHRRIPLSGDDNGCAIGREGQCTEPLEIAPRFAGFLIVSHI
jgi:hypothetical protein